MNQTATPALSLQEVENHPLVGNANAIHRDRLSATERICRKIADSTGAPLALLLVIIAQVVWVIVGTITHRDPYPFLFMLTISNIVQLIMIFVISVAQRQSSQHDEVRAEEDHDTISRLMYHQQLQDQILLRLAERTGSNVEDLKPTFATLMTDAPA